MNHSHLEGVFGTKLVELSYGSHVHLVGFIKMPGWYNYKIVQPELLNRIQNLPIHVRLATQKEALDFMQLSYPLPKSWCVPAPENGKVLFYHEDALHTITKVGETGVHFPPTDEVLICLEMLPCLN